MDQDTVITLNMDQDTVITLDTIIMILIFHEMVTILTTGIGTGDTIQGIPRDGYYPNYRYWYRGYNTGYPRKHEDL